jgi:hypothetical protein
MDNERRVKSRYPIELNVRYQTMETAGPVAGVGQTKNISSSGMLLACRSSIPVGTRIKVVVEWPSLLNGTTPLQLITMGTVIRHEAEGLSIEFESYQFRTMGRAKHSNVTQMPERTSTSYSSVQTSATSAQPPLSLIAKSSS